MYYAYDGSMHTITQKMHEKYGPVVRMAPNYLDLDYDNCAALIKTCFDTKGVWKKVRFVPSFLSLELRHQMSTPMGSNRLTSFIDGVAWC